MFLRKPGNENDTIIDKIRIDGKGEYGKRNDSEYRGEDGVGEYEDVKGFCKVAKLAEIREHEYILTPGRYVGIEDVEDDGIPFDEKMDKLTTELAEQFAKSAHLEQRIRKNLGKLGYEI